MSDTGTTVARSADDVAKAMDQAIRDALFSEWDFPAGRLRCAYEDESSDPEGDSDHIEMIDESGARWQIDLTVTATCTSNPGGSADEPAAR